MIPGLELKAEHDHLTVPGLILNPRPGTNPVTRTKITFKAAIWPALFLVGVRLRSQIHADEQSSLLTRIARTETFHYPRGQKPDRFCGIGMSDPPPAPFSLIPGAPYACPQLTAVSLDSSPPTDA
jgi:hypothetical protein